MAAPKLSGQSSLPRSLKMIMVGVVMVIALIFAANKRGGIVEQEAATTKTAEDQDYISKLKQNTINLEQGTVSGIPYYQCAGPGDPSSKVFPLVLLHGAKFTKEDWKTSGIMDDFCSRASRAMTGSGQLRVSVFAMDLPVRASHEDLMALLDAMEGQQLLSKPVSLVTPSASGKTMVDWAASDATHVLANYIMRWIPVAAIAVNNAPKSDIEKLKDVQLQILAIYGDQDAPGKQSSERLKAAANAKVVELQGRHPCYLDSPTRFVTKVLRFVEE